MPQEISPDELKLINRYLKIRALAERGDSGEKQSAAKKLQAMELENPWLADFAAQYEQASRQAGQTPDPLNPETWADLDQEAIQAFWQAVRDGIEANKPPKGAGLKDRITWRAMSWLGEVLEDLIDDTQPEADMRTRKKDDSNGKKKQEENPKKPKRAVKKPIYPKDLGKWLLKEGVEVGFGEDEDSGEEVVTLDMVLPRALVERLIEDGAGELFGEFLLSQVEQAIAEEDEEEEDEDDEDSE